MNEENIHIPTMMKLKDAAALSGLSYNYLRILCKTNKIIHIKTGNKYLVNMERLAEYLNGGID